MKRAFVPLAALTAVLLAAACSSSANKSSTSGSSSTSTTSTGGASTSTTPLRITLIAPISVPALSAAATVSVNSAKAAVKVLNSSGGVLGQPVQLDIEDDAGTPTTGVSKLVSAVSGGSKPAVVIQADGSTVASAVLPLANQDKIVTLNHAGTATSGDPTKFPYNFDTAPSTESSAAAFCPEVKALGGTSFGLIHQDDPYADGETDFVAKACQAAGLKLAGNEKFAVTALDVTPQLAALQAKKPDVLILSSYGAPSSYVLQDLDKLGWQVPILGDPAVVGSPSVTTPPPSGMLGTKLEANLKILVYKSNSYSASQPQPVTDMITAMKSFGPIDATLVTALGWDDVMLAAAAAKAAGTTTDAAKIAAALVSLPAGGPPTAVFPEYAFSTTSHASDPAPSAYTFVKPTRVVDGQFGNPSAS